MQGDILRRTSEFLLENPTFTLEKTMTFTSDTQLKRIWDGLLAHTLPKADWTHAAHFAAALMIIIDEGYDAHADMPDIIRSYNEVTGVKIQRRKVIILSEKHRD